MWAIIGGTGFESFSDFKLIENLDVNTPFGKTSSGLAKASINNTEIIFLPRHGKKHETLPSEINYRANIYALKRYGASKILAFSSVGSLREHLKPGTMVIPTQYINRTSSLRAHTFCGNGLVGHVSLAKPMTHELLSALQKIQHQFSFNIQSGQTSICIEGPYFSTKAESRFYREMGADIIGMTAFPEYALAREAGIAYISCSFITDLDCWDDSIPHVTQDEITKALKINNENAFQIAKTLIPITTDLLPNGCPELGLKTSLITKIENIPEEQKQIFEVLVH